jgi:hypothetical protein
MFCPSCGQERISDETRFCSRCGFLLSGTYELLMTGGVIPQAPVGASQIAAPRTRGLKQGLFIFLLTFLIVPIVAIISVALDLEPWGIPISAILLFVGGLLRMAYAQMFESAAPGGQTLEENVLGGVRTAFDRAQAAPALPAQTAMPAEAYVSPRAAGQWRDTNDLQPATVTENTTQLLEQDGP